MQDEKIKELEGKLLVLDDTINKLQKMTKEKDELLKEKSNYIALNNTYKEQLEKSQSQLELMKNKNNELEKSFMEEYKIKTEFLMEKIDLEKNKTILKLREDNYLALNKLQEDYNKRIIELLKYNKERDEEIKVLKEINISKK